jgi:pimeloyl-ACP methyl ester carboxylesterase
MTATREATRTGTGSFAAVNDLDLYYEVHGTGEPLVVIPGGMMTIAMMGPIIPALAQSRQVIAIEPQAHGHTADVDRPLSYEQLADDTAALIEQLGLGRVDVLGFSVGAGVALQTAIRHPEALRKLVVVSGTFRGDGEFPEIRAIEAAFSPDMPVLAQIRDAYFATSAKSDGWASLVEKMRRLLAEEYDWSDQVRAIEIPTLVVVGDADTLPVTHAVELFRLLGGDTAASVMGQLSKAQLAVLPGTTHFGIMGRTELLLAIVNPFLDAPMPEAGSSGME